MQITCCVSLEIVYLLFQGSNGFLQIKNSFSTLARARRILMNRSNVKTARTRHGQSKSNAVMIHYSIGKRRSYKKFRKALKKVLLYDPLSLYSMTRYKTGCLALGLAAKNQFDNRFLLRTFIQLAFQLKVRKIVFFPT